jgi:hypothetical protein
MEITIHTKPKPQKEKKQLYEQKFEKTQILKIEVGNK